MGVCDKINHQPKSLKSITLEQATKSLRHTITKWFGVGLVVMTFAIAISASIQKQVDDCNIDLTQLKLKHLLLSLVQDSPSLRDYALLASATDTLSNEKWVITQSVPASRTMSDSEFDMTKYSVALYFDAFKVLMDIDGCGNVINFGKSEIY